MKRILDLVLRLGLWLILFLGPLKWGLPILEPDKSPLPLSLAEWLLASWPIEVFCFSVYCLFFLQCLSFLWNGTFPDIRPRWLFFGPCFFFIVCVVSSLFSVHPSLSRANNFVTGATVMLFFLLLWHADKYRWFASAVLASMGVVVAVALFQHFGGFAQTAQWASIYLSAHPELTILQAKLASGRVFSTLVYPNSLGGYLVMTIPVAAFCWAIVERWSQARVFLAWVSVVLSAAACYALFLTHSQGAWLALFLLILIVQSTSPNPSLQRRGIKWVYTLVFFGVFAVFAMAFADAIKWDTLLMRWTYWVAALKMGASRWWIGYGPGSFGVVFPRFKLDWGGETQFAHSHFLQVFAEVGLVGLIAWCSWWVGWMFLPRRDGKAYPWFGWSLLVGLVGFLLHGALDFNFSVPGLVVPAIFLLALVYSDRCVISELPLRAGIISRWVVGIALALGLLIMPYGIFYREAMAQGCFLRSVQYAAENDWKAARSALDEAIVWSPRVPVYYFYRGALSEKLSEFDLALADYATASQLAPTISYYYFRTAANVAPRSHLLAILAMRQAVAHFPGNLDYRLALKRLEDKIGSGQ